MYVLTFDWNFSLPFGDFKITQVLISSFQQLPDYFTHLMKGNHQYPVPMYNSSLNSRKWVKCCSALWFQSWVIFLKLKKYTSSYFSNVTRSTYRHKELYIKRQQFLDLAKKKWNNCKEYPNLICVTDVYLLCDVFSVS